MSQFRSASARRASAVRRIAPALALPFLLAAFAAPTAHAADQPPVGGTLAGDFNGDGLMDFVAATTGTAAQSSHQVIFGTAGVGRAKTLEEGGQGVRLTLAGIQPASGAPLTFRPPVRIGDFDGDSYDDLTIDGFGGRSWVVFGGPNPGTLAVAEGDPRVTLLLDFTGPNSTGSRTSFGVGDWNGDGYADFIQPHEVPATLGLGEYGASRGHGMIVFGGPGAGINTNGRVRVRDLRNWSGGASSIMGRQTCGFFSNGWVPVYGCRVSFTWPIPVGDYDGDGKSDLYQPTGSIVLRGRSDQGGTVQAMDRGYNTMDVPTQPEGNAWLPANDPARGTTHATYTCDLGGYYGKLGLRYTPDLPTTWPSGTTSFGLTADLKWDAAAEAALRIKNVDYYGGPLVVPVTLKNAAGAPVRVNVTVTMNGGYPASGRSADFAAPVGSPTSLTVGSSLIGDLKGYNSTGAPIGWGTSTDHDGDPTTSDLRCDGPEAEVPRNGIVPRPTPGPTPAPGTTPTPKPTPSPTPVLPTPKPAPTPAPGRFQTTYTCDEYLLGPQEVDAWYEPTLPESWAADANRFPIRGEFRFRGSAWMLGPALNASWFTARASVDVAVPGLAGSPLKVPMSLGLLKTPATDPGINGFARAASGGSPSFTQPTAPPSSLEVRGLLFSVTAYDASSRAIPNLGKTTDSDGNPNTFDMPCTGPAVTIVNAGAPTPAPTPKPTATPTPPTPAPSSTPTPAPTPAPAPDPAQTGTYQWLRSVVEDLPDGNVLVDGTAANATGWMYDRKRKLDANELRVDFDLELGTIPGVAPGNGATLAFASESQGGVLLGGNTGLGLGWVTNKGNAIVFGTVKGGLTPSDNYVAIANGVVGKSGYPTLLTSAAAATPLAGHTTHVTFRASGGVVSVALNGTERLRWVGSLPTDAWVGFTAATSTARQRVAVRNVVMARP